MSMTVAVLISSRSSSCFFDKFGRYYINLRSINEIRSRDVVDCIGGRCRKLQIQIPVFSCSENSSYIAVEKCPEMIARVIYRIVRIAPLCIDRKLLAFLQIDPFQ